MTKFDMEWRANFTLFIVLVLCSVTATTEAKWCTQTKSELMQHEVTVTEKCNQTYQDSCSFFSWETCQYVELVDCQVKKNTTITRYFLVEDCCPGYKLDPINNVTCIRSSDGPIKSPPKPPKEWFKPSVTVAQVEKSSVGRVTQSGNGNNASHNNDDGEDGDSTSEGQTSHAIEDDDANMLFGLSYGAYAGIICTLLFILCVFILIMLHVRKRSRRNMEKMKQSNNMEIETTQKMLNVPA